MKKVLLCVLALAFAPAAFADDAPLPFDEPAYAVQVVRTSAPQKQAVSSKYGRKVAAKSSRKQVASRNARNGKYASASKRKYAQKNTRSERRQLAANTRR
ncbi:hypothetical protein [Chitinolyticbacter albus]|uniref:hypothetical protein n=1 Tax=Chitinolyticbacter albus TaxID=2961951 RepID=UPI00210AF31C|nr:hypothetical protein [Chitinolyticbacter albus]